MSGDPFKSLSEIDAQCRKAARGAGYEWGMAEEVGKAVRWLAARRLAGVATFARFLNDGIPPAIASFTESEGCWNCPCPVRAGAVVADRLALLDEVPGPVFDLRRVTHPLLMLGIVGYHATASSGDVEMNWPGFAVRVSSSGVDIANIETWPSLVPTVTVKRPDDTELPVETRCLAARIGPAPVAAEDWKIIDRFAQKTYAPATAESRNSGAGAGLTDND